jgi:hypothetical protein
MKRLLAVGAVAIGLLCNLPSAAGAAPVNADMVRNGGVFFCGPDNGDGSACIDALTNGFDAMYENTTSSWQYVDFNLVLPDGRHIGDHGAFCAAPGSERTYFFATGPKPDGYDNGVIEVYARKPPASCHTPGWGWFIASPPDYQPGL